MAFVALDESARGSSKSSAPLVIGFREPGALGLVDVNNDAVYLPLRKGDNELVLAVTEFFGGWGFICRLE